MIEIFENLDTCGRLQKGEISLADVNRYIEKTLLESDQAFYNLYVLSSASDREKISEISQKDFQQLFQSSSSRSTSMEEIMIDRVARAIHQDPFLLISCLIPAAIQGLVPGGGAEHDQKLETLKKILESFRPVFKRVLAEEIQNQSLDPLVQALVKLALSEASRKDFLKEFTQSFIVFFSALAQGEPIEDSEKTFTQQMVNRFVVEIRKARQFWQNIEIEKATDLLQSDAEKTLAQQAKQKANHLVAEVKKKAIDVTGWQTEADKKREKIIPLRNAGQFSLFEEFLLIDLPVLSQGFSIAKLITGLIPFLKSEETRGLFTDAVNVCNIGFKAFTGKTLEGHLIDSKQKENPNGLLSKFLNKLEPGEKEEIGERIRKDILPLFLSLAPDLERNHDVKFYEGQLSILKNAIQSVEPIDDTEVSKAFASILVNLLGEIESYYVPVLESICKAFWKIGK